MMPMVEVNPRLNARLPTVSASCGFLMPPPTTELMLTWKSAYCERNSSFLSRTLRLFLEISSGCTLSIEIWVGERFAAGDSDDARPKARQVVDAAEHLVDGDGL